MANPWTKFWMGIAVMGWVGLIAGPAGPRLQWGTIGEWFAALATFAAVYVALKTARDEGALALRVALEDRAERRALDTENSVRLLKTALLIINQAISTMVRANKNFADYDREKYAKAVLDSPASRLVSESLDQIRLDQLPTTTSVDLVMAAKAAWIGIVEKLTLASTDWIETFGDNELVDTRWIEQASDRLADEIVRLGGKGDTYEDVGVQLSIGLAEARARAADPH